MLPGRSRGRGDHGGGEHAHAGNRGDRGDRGGRPGDQAERRHGSFFAAPVTDLKLPQ